MDEFNVYMIGVGGQGIGLLSELVTRAVDHAGLKVKGVDTHGLAQRGGIVVSHLRVGNRVYSPMIPLGRADIVVALERNEALRGVKTAAKKGGTLVYYDAEWQPLGVRLGTAEPVGTVDIEKACAQKDVTVYRIHDPCLNNPKMQNIMVLSAIVRYALIPGVDHQTAGRAMADLMGRKMLEENMVLFNLQTQGG
ncbi:IorB4 [Desulforapulum autotrophicum HRM2]|jgi:indolepyruvate ferredoxin oxidoreductase beta subunit|uniref:IorB4 n=1 Tax=Desulforapulum autotrophicum (strain ATCC 43914 / DSM 3382 / VKM B-1955 / HRM2) TaxID=177437 RepID=C0QCB8_DESAH|nr:2-oxoacid:acceptor oxidoreductase family protein [Desulforapulum autotrophicum]ACN17135.1 IorB4 [Desulforapulum autotrophicum HRM2]